MTDAPETIWHTIDRQGKISGSRDAHVEPCLEVSSSYIAYTRTDISQARIAELEAALQEIRTALDYEVEYNDQGMGCGIEDRGITDRYEAMSFGWDSAEDRYNSEVIQCADEIACAALKAKP
jgi:hypothetical protein